MLNIDREEIVDRIKNYQIVIRDLENTEAWKILLKDIEEQKNRIDSSWQDIYDEEKLQAARVLKNATMHICTLVDKYREELEGLQYQLDVIDNPDKNIMRDYDND